MWPNLYLDTTKLYIRELAKTNNQNDFASRPGIQTFSFLQKQLIIEFIRLSYHLKNTASCKWRDAQRAMRNFFPLKMYRLYTISAYLDVRAILFTFNSAVHVLHCRCLGAGERRYLRGRETRCRAIIIGEGLRLK